MRINLQNMYMYGCSILLITLSMAIGVRGDETLGAALEWKNLSTLFSPYIFPLVCVMSCVGIVTRYIYAKEVFANKLLLFYQHIVFPFLFQYLFEVS